MRRILGVVVLLFCAAGTAGAAETGLQIQLIDGRLSIQAQSVGLGRLLGLIDRATGMTSKVPLELVGRNVSVRFTDLSMDDAVRKIFEGQAVDYVVIQGKGIIVTALSQARRDLPGSPAAPFPTQPAFQAPAEQPFSQDEPPLGQPPQVPMLGGPMPGMPGQQFPPGAAPNGSFDGQQPQPAMIQTPFGAIPNPRANQPGMQNMLGQPGQQQSPFGSQPAFGTIGIPASPAQNPNLFGNTSPPIMNTVPAAIPPQQRRP